MISFSDGQWSQREEIRLSPITIRRENMCHCAPFDAQCFALYPQRLSRTTCGLPVHFLPSQLRSAAPHTLVRGFVLCPDLQRLVLPCRHPRIAASLHPRLPVFMSTIPITCCLSPTPTAPIPVTPVPHPRTTPASLFLHLHLALPCVCVPTQLSGCQFLRSNAPAFLSLRPAPHASLTIASWHQAAWGAGLTYHNLR